MATYSHGDKVHISCTFFRSSDSCLSLKHFSPRLFFWSALQPLPLTVIFIFSALLVLLGLHVQAWSLRFNIISLERYSLTSPRAQAPDPLHFHYHTRQRFFFPTLALNCVDGLQLHPSTWHLEGVPQMFLQWIKWNQLFISMEISTRIFLKQEIILKCF